MRLATIRNGSADGRLALVSADGARVLPPAQWQTLQSALENWQAAQPALAEAAARLAAGEGEPAPAAFAAPLPRAWQWLDGSAFTSHGDLMQVAFNQEPIATDKPLMYQGISDSFLGPRDDVPLPTEDDGIDFEGEFGVIVDRVPMGTSAADALSHIRLIVQINDWSLRIPGAAEMRTGFGWIQAKPACSAAPFAVTPDELGEYWRDGRVHLNLHVDWNGRRFGAAHGGAMAFGFHELVAHAARTRNLVAGTVIGSGTVSNAGYREVGSSCIAERRAIEMLDSGRFETGFMRFDDRVRMEAVTPQGFGPFGVIDQRVVRA